MLACLPAAQVYGQSLGWSAEVSATPQTAPVQIAPASAPSKSPATKPQSAKPAATRVHVEASGDNARLVFDLTQRVPVTASVLTDPDRVVVDLPEVDFRIAAEAGQKRQGLVNAFRYGLLGPRQSRLVIDTNGPVQITIAQVEDRPGRSPQLVIGLTRGDAALSVKAPSQAPPAAPQIRTSTLDDDPLPQAAKRKIRPVIVIDAGHGGVDPGAVGANGLLEKNVVLGVSRQLRAQLAATGRYTVILTRSTDVFVSLNDRLRISRESQADLFISLHADAVAETTIAQSVRGGTIYMLSEHASDEQARRLAEKENAVDMLAGLESTPRESQDDVRGILVDLLRRETTDFSSDFRGMLTDELRKHIALAREPQRSASFKVLKQTHSPSVLVELGYMSNAEDQKLLKSVEWQKRVAGGIADAIHAYFAKRAVGAVHAQ